MRSVMMWGVQVTEDKNLVTVEMTYNKAEAAKRADELGGKLVRVRAMF